MSFSISLHFFNIPTIPEHTLYCKEKHISFRSRW